MKRLVSVLLAVCIVCTMLYVPAGAIVDDHTPPVVTGVYMNSPGATVTGGDILHFSIGVEDAESDLQEVDIEFTYMCSQGHEHTISRYLYNWSSNFDYDSTTGIFSVDISIANGYLNGTYTLSRVYACDSSGNGISYYLPDPDNYRPGNPGNIDFNSVSFTIVGCVDSETDDHTPPTVTSVSMDNTGKVVTSEDKICLTIALEDASDLQEVDIEFTCTCDQGLEHSISRYLYNWSSDFNYDSSSGMFTTDIVISDSYLDGTYTLSRIYVCDSYNNGISYYPPDPDNYRPGNPGNINFDSISFTIIGCEDRENDDHIPPVVTSVSMDEFGKIVAAGDTLRFTIGIENEPDLQEVDIEFTYTCDQGHEHTISRYLYDWSSNFNYDKISGIFTIDITIADTYLNGTYTLSRIYVCDSHSNSITYYPPDPDNYRPGNPGNIDFDSIYFTIATPDVVPTKVSIPETITVSQRDVYTIRPDVTPIDSIPKWSWTSQDTSICTVNSTDRGMNCLVTGVSPGTTTITGVTQNGLRATSTVTVLAAPLPTGGSVADSYNVGVGGFIDIKPDLVPPNATSLFEVTSDNPHVASADLINGGTAIRITGNNAGKATLTIRGANGLKLTTTIIVGSPTDRQHEKEIVPGYESTCTYHGRTDAVRCSACYYYFVESEELPLAPHTEETVPGREATCTRVGYTESVRCSVCWETLVEAEEIPTIPHSFTEWEIVEEATPSSTGLRSRHCEVCWLYETEEFSYTSEPTLVPTQPGTSDPNPTGTPSSTTAPSPSPTTEPAPTSTVDPIQTPSISPTPSSTNAPTPSSTNAPTPSSTATPAPSSTAEPTSTPAPTVEPTPEPTKPQVNVGEQNIEVTVDKDSATVTVPEKDLEDALDAAAEKGVLEVDVSNLEDVSEVTISQNVVDAVTKSEDVSGLTLKTASGDITLDGNALQTVADAVTSEHDEVKLSVKTIDPDDIPTNQKYPIASVLNHAVFIELSADVIHKDASGRVTGTDAIHEFNGEVTVSVPYEQPENMQGRQIIACYIADDGSITYFNVTYENGIATFTTVHFSRFAIVESYAAAFEDIDVSKWYMSSVEYALANGLMAGESATIFAPDEKVSRAMAVQLLYNFSGKPETTGTATFADVETGKWYAPAIAWAEDKAVVAGYSKDVFAPADLVTREQLATMLWQYAGRPETAGSIDTYEDAADVSSWAKEALCWAVEPP